MVQLLIFLAILYGIYLLMPYIGRWVRRMMMRRAEKYVRDMFGMPPPTGAKQRSKKEEEKPRRRPGKPYHRPRPTGVPAIPPEYAEDVEYVEYKEYTSTETISHQGDELKYTLEEQVTDAKWVEIKEGER